MMRLFYYLFNELIMIEPITVIIWFVTFIQKIIFIFKQGICSLKVFYKYFSFRFSTDGLLWLIFIDIVYLIYFLGYL